MKPAVDSARRLVAHPVDAAYVRRGLPAREAMPAIFPLGAGGAVLLLRFSVPLPANANVVEAYLVLHRAGLVDDDPTPISLHATRIVEGWEGRSTSWARLPRLAETRAPSTVVEPGGPALVRLDVRDLVRQWARHDPDDQGLAVTADTESATGTTFAFSRAGADRGFGSDLNAGPPGVARSDVRPRSAPDVEPYLELYVR